MAFDNSVDTFFDEPDVAAENTANADLLALIESAPTAKKRTFNDGEAVKGTILSVGHEFIFVDIGAKNEAVIRTAEFIDDKGVPTVKSGETLEAFVTSVDDAEIVLSKSPVGKGRKLDLDQLMSVLENRTPIDGRITGVNKGGFNVSVLDGKRAFCPFSQIDLRYNGEPAGYLNTTMQFVITKVEEKGRNIVVSRLPILEKDQGARFEEVAALAGSGKTITGTVTRIQKFGLFVDIGGGFEGLVHISEVSWDRTDNLDASFTTGKKVDVIILKVEKGDPLRDSRISLSIKQAGADPWSTAGEKFTVGMSVSGTITRLFNFGAFVQIATGIEALIPISEMSWGKRINHPSDVVKEGQSVTVTILAVDDLSRKISCSLKDAASDPWATATEKYQVGALVQGVVASEQKYGFFIDLDEAITGLLAHVRVAKDKKGQIKKGQTIEVRIDSLDTAARRVGLSFGDVEAAEADEKEARVYLEKMQQPVAGASAGESDFADILKMALAKKKK